MDYILRGPKVFPPESPQGRILKLQNLALPSASPLSVPSYAVKGDCIQLTEFK